MAGISFSKLAASTAMAANGTDKFALKDEQKGELISIITENSFCQRYGKYLDDIVVNAGSITVMKNVAGTIKDKGATLGAGTPEKMKIDSATIQIDTNPYINEGVSAFDMARGLDQVAAKKLAKFGDQVRKQYERAAIAKIKAAATTEVNEIKISIADLNSGDPAKLEKIRAKIYGAAIDLTLTNDPAQGLDLIDRSHIMVDLGPTVFDKIVASKVVGNIAQINWIEGIYGQTRVSGMETFANPYMETEVADNIAGVITTDFAMACPMKLIATTIEKLPQTNDTAVYVEAGYGQDFVYKKVMTRIVFEA